jgi:hypothetical protein
MFALSLALGALSVLLLAYLVRGSRQLGTKLSKLESSNAKGFKNIEKMLNAQEALAKRNSQLLYLMQIQRKELDWKFEVSVTSHPARFHALALSLTALKSQILQPQSINVFIAERDMAALPDSIKELQESGYIKITPCQDLGSGKKLIPALKTQGLFPIITIDDDLYFENDLFLHLMINEYISWQLVIQKMFSPLVSGTNTMTSVRGHLKI